MTPLLIILQIIWEILKLINRRPAKERAGLLARLRAARIKAEQTGDTSDLEALMAELARK